MISLEEWRVKIGGYADIGRNRRVMDIAAILWFPILAGNHYYQFYPSSTSTNGHFCKKLQNNIKLHFPCLSPVH